MNKKQSRKFLIPIIIVFILFSIFAFFFGDSVKLTCEKLEKSYTKCQLQNFRFFRIVSTPVKNFRLTKTDIETDESTNSDTKFYTLILYENDRPIEFYEHREFILFNEIQSDKARIDTFLVKGDERETLKIHSQSYIRVGKHLIDFILISIVYLIFSGILFSLNMAVTFTFAKIKKMIIFAIKKIAGIF